MFKEKYRSYIHWGVTIFILFVCCILFFFAVLRFGELRAFVGLILSTLSPVIWGIVIAYLLWPIVRTVRNFLIPRLPAFIRSEKKRYNISLGLGAASALLVMLLVIVIVAGMVLPELIKTTMTFVGNFNTYVSTVEGWITELLANNPEFQDFMRSTFERMADTFNNWIQNDLLGQLNIILTGLTSGVIGFGRSLLNFIIGIVVSIYLFAGKDTFAGQFKKILYALFKPEQANLILDVLRHSDKIFGGFISGKILDSLIIGVLCFIILSILKMPYTILVSVVVGVTNVIPVFGPFIGAIPSAFLILLVDPRQSLVFIAFILILQQVDGNIIGPAILGDSTGLSAFWVMFSILLGGGLFGFTGMLLGVPTFAVLYYTAKRLVEHKLRSRRYPTETSAYSPEWAAIDPATRQIVIQKEAQVTDHAKSGNGKGKAGNRLRDKDEDNGDKKK